MEREETIYCSKVPRTPISASLNVYYQFLASEPCLAALLSASLSLPSYPTPSLLSVLLSFHIACFHSILHISSMSSNLSLFLSARHSPLSPGSSVNQCLYQCSLCCSICVLNLSVLFYHRTHTLPLSSITSLCFCLVLSLPLVLLFISPPRHPLN